MIWALNGSRAYVASTADERTGHDATVFVARHGECRRTARGSAGHAHDPQLRVDVRMTRARPTRSSRWLRILYYGAVATGLWLTILVVPAMAASPSSHADAPQDQSDDQPPVQTEAPAPLPAAWLQTGLQGPAGALYTPSSGAFFSRTERGLQRSDDGGDTWRLVNLPVAPSELGGVAVDPSDHQRLLVEGPGGIYRTVDDARTWSLVFPMQHRKVLRLAISPVDGRLLYMGLRGVPGGPSDESPSTFWFLRSMDGGLTFTELEHGTGMTCSMSLPILQPHPRDADVLFRAVACLAGRTYQNPLTVSRDRGATFETSLFTSLELAYAVVGGRGIQPDRFYAVMNRDQRAGGATLYRSDDGATTWTSVLEYRNEVRPTGTPVPPITTIAAVAYDPAQPDHIWVALGHDADGVQFSADGGATWQDAGARDLGEAHALALGVDGRSLYLSTDRGLWRQPQDHG